MVKFNEGDHKDNMLNKFMSMNLQNLNEMDKLLDKIDLLKVA